MVEFGQKLLYSGKVVVFLAKVVVFGEKCLCSGKMVVFESGKVVVFEQKWL